MAKLKAKNIKGMPEELQALLQQCPQDVASKIMGLFMLMYNERQDVAAQAEQLRSQNAELLKRIDRVLGAAMDSKEEPRSLNPFARALKKSALTRAQVVERMKAIGEAYTKHQLSHHVGGDNITLKKLMALACAMNTPITIYPSDYEGGKNE